MFRLKHHLLMLLLLLAAPSFALARANGFTVVTTIPIDELVEGCGERVRLSGELHSVFHITIDGTGGIHVAFVDNRHSVTGVGLTTGTTYHGTGVFQASSNEEVDEYGRFEITVVSSFKLIGQGTTDNLLMQSTSHITVNENGEVTAVAENSFTECQG